MMRLPNDSGGDRHRAAGTYGHPTVGDTLGSRSAKEAECNVIG